MLKPYGGDWFTAQTALRTWYATALGAELHARIASRIEVFLRDIYALHCLQLGGTQQGVDLLDGRALVHRVHVTGDGAEGMRAEPSFLPLATRSTDLVLLCHVLEFSDDPHALLREVDRILALDGHLLVVGFNPWSLFGLRRLLGGAGVPWSGRFYSPRRVEDWCRLLGLRTCRHETLWLRPPLQHAAVRRRTAGVERLQRLLPGAGAIYLTLARKRSVPFTPLPASRERETVPAGRAVRPTQRGELQWRRR